MFSEGIVGKEETWETYFSTHHVEPLVVGYEELVADYSNLVYRVLRHLGMDATLEQIVPPGIGQQATSLNYEWGTRFTAHLARAKGS